MAFLPATSLVAPTFFNQANPWAVQPRVAAPHVIGTGFPVSPIVQDLFTPQQPTVVQPVETVQTPCPVHTAQHHHHHHQHTGCPVHDAHHHHQHTTTGCPVHTTQQVSASACNKSQHECHQVAQPQVQQSQPQVQQSQHQQAVQQLVAASQHHQQQVAASHHHQQQVAAPHHQQVQQPQTHTTIALGIDPVTGTVTINAGGVNIPISYNRTQQVQPVQQSHHQQQVQHPLVIASQHQPQAPLASQHVSASQHPQPVQVIQSQHQGVPVLVAAPQQSQPQVQQPQFIVVQSQHGGQPQLVQIA